MIVKFILYIMYSLVVKYFYLDIEEEIIFLVSCFYLNLIYWFYIVFFRIVNKLLVERVVGILGLNLIDIEF